MLAKNSSKSFKISEKWIIPLKISIICFSGIYLIGNFIPFYEGADAYLYGILAVNFSDGIYSISNTFLDETGKSQFMGTNWLKTIHGDAVPRSGITLGYIASIFYSAFGYYALFYFSPIIAILLFIVSERIATKLFGSVCGLLTLLFVTTNHLIFRNSLNLQTEALFSLLSLIGVYCFITFFKSKVDTKLLFASVFFVFASFIRINGLAFLPIEIGIIMFVFIFKHIRPNFKKNCTLSTQKFYRISIKRGTKLAFFIILPWMVFFVFWISYYDYYFDEQTINYRQVTATANEFAYNPETHTDAKFASLFLFEDKTLENTKGFSKYILPYQIPAVHNKLDNNFDNILGNDWIGIIAIAGLGIFSIWSIYNRNKRIEFLTFIGLISVTVWFFSAVTTSERAAYGYPGRYMIGSFILFVMMISFFIVRFLKIKVDNKKKYLRVSIKITKIFLIFGLFVFFILAYYNANPVQAILNEEEFVKNPEDFVERYPLDLEGLSSNSVIIAHNGDWVIEYGLTPFFPLYKGEVSLDSVNLLKEVINDGNDVYIFKTPTTNSEKDTIRNLVNNHGFIVSDFSKSFCSVEIKNNTSNKTSDYSCLN